MKKIILSIFCSLVIALGGLYWAVVKPALANVVCSLPFSLTNGTIADATQVMANYNALVTCLSNAAAAGANNDITSLSGLTTPLTPNQGGSNVYIGASPTASGDELFITTTSPTNWSNTRGYSVIFTAVATNTSIQTMSVNAQARKNVFKQSTAGPVQLSGGEIVPNQQYFATYDGTQFQINPVPSLAVGWGLQAQTATLTGINLTNPPYGFGPCVNLTISATVGAGLLGVQLFAADTGLAPTGQHPILCSFRDSTITNGGPVWRSITSAVYLDSNAVGATLGVITSQAFRLWITAFDNGGTATIALWHSGSASATPSAFALQEGAVQSSTGISNASTSAGVFYTPNGTNLSSKSFRILGYLDWASGLATPGNYSSGPTEIQLFGPGIKKPGDVVQQVFAQAVTGTTQTAAANLVTNPWVSITPSAAPNLVRFQESTAFLGTSGAASGTMKMFRTAAGTPACTTQVSGSAFTLSGSVAFPLALAGLDKPGTAAQQTYSACINASAGTVQSCLLTTSGTNNQTCTIELWEIQG